MTRVGGVEMQARDAAAAAADEVLVHSWDLATAGGQPYAANERLVEFAHAWVQLLVAHAPQGIPGLFGPAVPVPDDAQVLDRLLGLTGRRV